MYYVLKKYRKSGALFDYLRSGWPKILSERLHQLIDDWLHDNKLQNEEEVTASTSSVA